MKTPAMIFLALAIAAGAHAQEHAHRAKILDLEGQTQLTPRFSVSGPRAKDQDSRYWIEIEAEIEVETKDPSGFIPELETRWFAVIKDKHSGKPVRLTGKATFRNIRTKGNKVHLSAYIDPDTLERLTGEDKPKESDIEGYALVISGPGIVTDDRHAAGLVMATAEKEAKWWEVWEGKSMEDMILPKSKTPFAPLWSDYYPAEKEPVP
ncbi:hypothetical protein HZ994_10660 [Akkermansiaceae bacterium]|nr:hypothetical protein HZ994_10660 [Akkermansiaceae bacterium]